MKKYSVDYLDDILVRMAHNNSAIEGNTISLPETVSIILEGTLPGKHKSIREFYEIENHKESFDFLMKELEKNSNLSVSLIKNFHIRLMDRLQHDRGQFKTTQNAIVGADFRTASPEETPELMQQWVDNTTYRLESFDRERKILEALAESHIQFQRIHPFADGNGRTGRLLLMYLSMKYLELPVVVNKENRGAYISLLAAQDFEQLADLFESSIKFERMREVEFGNR